MLTAQPTYKIHCQLLASHHFFIHATSATGEHLPVSEWAPLFMQWESTSHYGTNVREENSPQSGLLLTGYEWMIVTADEPFNSFVNWEWDNQATICLALGYLLQDYLDQNEAVLFQSQDEATLPVFLRDEFHPSFWTQEISGQDTWTFANQWFHAIYSTHPKRTWHNHLLLLIEKTGVSYNRAKSFFQTLPSETAMALRPFSLGVRLTDPVFENGDNQDDWKLEVFVRDKEHPQTMLAWENRSTYPDHWASFVKETELQLTAWKVLFPWFSERINAHEAWLFITQAAEILLAIDVEVLLPAWWQSMQKARLQVKANVKKTVAPKTTFVGMDALVKFDWQLAIDNQSLSADEFRELVKEQRDFIYLNGHWKKLDLQFMRQVRDMMKEADEKGLSIQTILQQKLADNAHTGEQLDEESQIDFNLDNNLNQLVHQLHVIEDIPLVSVPKGLNGVLRPYQIQGMSWLLFMRKHHLGCCLADDMGLGKTVQFISYLLAVLENGEEGGPTLIICPTSVLGNWQKELERFAPSLKVALHYGSKRKSGDDFTLFAHQNDVILTSYGHISQDKTDIQGIQWNCIVLDEAQNIKNPHTKVSRAARQLNGTHHIAMTGTPMENRLSELWTLFDFTNRGLLGSQSQFEQTYAIPIEREHKQEVVRHLQKMIQPFLLRRTKQDKQIALNLPDKLEQKEFIALSTEQTVLYEQTVQSSLELTRTLTGFARKGQILRLLARLKQICDHPALFLKEENPLHIQRRSGKTEKLIELLDGIIPNGESVLIFTQYIQMGNLLQKLLTRRYGVPVSFLMGSIRKKQRDEMVDAFQQGNIRILILSLKTGGTGLNLTAANHVIHYDRWWNPAVENQATDRAHRIGQNKFVHVHKLISIGTLEEKIDVMLEKKQQLNQEIVQSDQWVTELSNEELSSLLVLSKSDS